MRVIPVLLDHLDDHSEGEDEEENDEADGHHVCERLLDAVVENPKRFDTPAESKESKETKEHQVLEQLHVEERIVGVVVDRVRANENQVRPAAGENEQFEDVHEQDERQPSVRRGDETKYVFDCDPDRTCYERRSLAK